MAITQNVNNRLEDKIINLEKNPVKREQYSQRNNAELSDILSSIPDEDLENMVIQICKELRVDVEARDIARCHRLFS